MSAGYIQKLLESKAGSEVRFDLEGRSDTAARLLGRVKFARNTVKKKGIVTIQREVGKGHVVKLLSDVSWPATDAELESLENKREPTLVDWARRRKRPVEAVVNEMITAPVVGPLIERLPPQDASRAAARGARVESAHPAIGSVPASGGSVSHLNLQHRADPQPAHEPASFDQTHEEQVLWREVFVASLRTNPMGKEEERVAAARAAVESFREFFAG